MKQDPTDNRFFVVEGLVKSFREKTVLNGVSFSIPKGKTTVILGGSGAGKSVLLKHLNGLLKPDAGSVSVENKIISGMNELELIAVRKRIGILFQNGALFDSMTVEDNVAFPLRENSMLSEAEITDRVKAVLHMVHLEGSEQVMPADLSGGMRKRVGLARAVITRPDAMLYDEPTAGLDPVLSDKVAVLVNGLGMELELTSVVVTHNLRLVKAVADQVIFLDSGKVLFAGTLDEIFESDDAVVSQFVNSKPKKQ